MIKKEKEKAEARRLRGEGKSVKEIVSITGVSKASISVWVRDIILTVDQRAELDARVPKVGCQGKGSVARSENALKKRVEWQSLGKEMYKKTNECDFALGCSLYWAEGYKNANSVEFCNTDKAMMRFFIGFLRKYFEIRNDEISIHLKFYSGNGITFDDAKLDWLNVLGLEESSLRKSQIDIIRKDGYGKKKGRKPYGVCYLKVFRTDVIQKILGEIQ